MGSRLAVCSLVAVALLSMSIRLAADEDYAVRFKELREQKADAEIEPLLNEWREKRPNDPDAWITSANYYFNLASGPRVSTKEAESGVFIIAEEKTGKVAGSLSFKPDDALAKKAAGFLAEGTRKFPNRLDIWCGLAYIHQERGDFGSEFTILKSMVAYARSHPAGLRWLKGAPLPASRDEFLADKLHTYGAYYHKKGNLEDGKRFLTLAMYAVEQFPHQVYAFNDVAAFYLTTGEWKKALEWLGKAHRVNPKDVIVLMNLGDVCAKLGDSAAARNWYSEAVKVDPEGEFARQATDALTKLKK